MSKKILLITIILLLIVSFGCPISNYNPASGSFFARGKIEVVEKPNTKLTNDFYIGNRPPLLPSPFIKLPIGAIRPKGWVQRLLDLQADGFTGHLLEISRFLKKEDNAWLSTEGQGHSPWEEVPYWLKASATPDTSSATNALSTRHALGSSPSSPASDPTATSDHAQT